MRPLLTSLPHTPFHGKAFGLDTRKVKFQYQIVYTVFLRLGGVSPLPAGSIAHEDTRRRRLST